MLYEEMEESVRSNESFVGRLLDFVNDEAVIMER